MEKRIENNTVTGAVEAYARCTGVSVGLPSRELRKGEEWIETTAYVQSQITQVFRFSSLP